MREFKKIFKKVNGFNILKQYKRSGVLSTALLATLIVGISRKGLEIVRLIVDNKTVCKLRKEYNLYIKEYLQKNKEYEFEVKRERSNKVWICWFQGIENAPELVKVCYESVKNNLKDRDIILITENNYKKYVTLPKHIQTKYNKGIITKTHFSDILRLELLIKYGGTWIDSTVLCTSTDIESYILNSDLFVYQCLKPGKDGHSTSISSWLMTSCTNNPIILLTRDLLYKYWGEYDYMKDYFLLHKFFELAIEVYPQEWKKVIPFSNSVPHILLLNLFEDYDEKWLENIKDMTKFHKLTYKFESNKIELENTFYKKIFTERK